MKKLLYICATINVAVTTVSSVVACTVGTYTKTSNINHAQPVIPQPVAMPTKIGDTYYLSSVTRGLYTSKDGIRWDRNEAKGISDKTAVYASPAQIGDLDYLPTAQGLYTSKDGVVWNNKMTQGLPSLVGYNPVMFDHNYYLALNNKIYMSQNGFNWGEDGKIAKGVQVSCNLTKINDTYYVATNSGVYKSNDLHQWNSLDYDFSADNVVSNPIKIDDNYYIAVDNEDFENEGLYTSKDGEDWDWSQVNGINPTAPIEDPPIKINGIYYEIDGSHNDSSYDSYGLFTSQDGVDWNQNATIGLPEGIDQIFFLPVKINDTYYLPVFKDLANWTMYTSLDGVHWSQSTTTTFPANASYDFIQSAPCKVGDMYYLLTNKGLYISEDGINWKRDTNYPSPYTT